MFKLTDEKIFPWPVEIHEPHPTLNGEKKVHKVRMQLRVLDDADLAELMNGDNENAEERIKDSYRKMIAGWDENDLCDDDDTKVPFSEEARERLIKFPYVREALQKAYQDAVKQGTRRKN